MPILVGGSGLFILTRLFIIFLFRQPLKPNQRSKLQKLSVSELQQRLIKKGIALPNNSNNPRHLIRTIETKGQLSVNQPLKPNTLLIGLKKDRKELELYLQKRVDSMLKNGLIGEIRLLLDKYDPKLEAFKAPGYKAFSQYVSGSLSIEEAKSLFVKYDLGLAKRQRTWFKRNKKYSLAK